jgi:hypothetical protein
MAFTMALVIVNNLFLVLVLLVYCTKRITVNNFEYGRKSMEYILRK